MNISHKKNPKENPKENPILTSFGKEIQYKSRVFRIIDKVNKMNKEEILNLLKSFNSEEKNSDNAIEWMKKNILRILKISEFKGIKKDFETKLYFMVLGAILTTINEKYEESDDEDKKEILKYTKKAFSMLSRYSNFPWGDLVLYKWSHKVINKIKKLDRSNNGSKLNIWFWFYPIPGCFDNLEYMFKNKYIDDATVFKFNIWNVCNIQEDFNFYNHEWVDYKRWDLNLEKNKVKNIDIHIWNNGSLPHMFWLKWDKDGKFTMDAWENFFGWIWTTVSSGFKAWNNVSIWFWSEVWYNCEIWNNVVIWQWVKIADNLQKPIPSNSLILHWSKINNLSERVFINETNIQDFIENRYKYRDRIIVFQDNLAFGLDKLLSQGWFETYQSIRHFNQSSVLPENEWFWNIDKLLKNLSDEIDEIGELRDEHYICKKIWLDNWWVLSLQAYPIDQDKFKLKEFNEIKIELSRIKKDESKDYTKIKEILSRVFWRPLINKELLKNKNKHFEWKVSIIWKCNISWEKTMIIGSKLRFDEKEEHETVEFENVYMDDCVVHWPWNVKVKNGKYIRTCMHWEFIAENDEIWSTSSPLTVLNAYESTGVKAVNGWISGHNLAFKSKNIINVWKWVVICPNEKNSIVIECDLEDWKIVIENQLNKESE